jgi:hypothetical protein
VPDEIVSKGEYAARLGVEPARISLWLRQGRLGPPAVVQVQGSHTGQVNVALADEMLGLNRLAKPIAETAGVFVAQRELPALSVALHLDRGQVLALQRWWKERRPVIAAEFFPPRRAAR